MEEEYTLDDTVLFDSYLRGAMTPEEKAVFEARLESEPDLREELEFHRQVMTDLATGAENKALKRQIGGIRQKMREKEHRSNAFIRFFVIATLLLLFVAAGVWYLWSAWEPADQEKGRHLPQDSVRIQDNPIHQQATPLIVPAPVASTQPDKIPQPGNKEKNAPDHSRSLAGAAIPDSFKLKSRITKIRAGQAGEDAGVIDLTVFKYTSDGLWSSRTDRSNIQLSVPENYFNRKAGFKFFELETGGKTELYLRLGTAYYAVPPGNKELKPEGNEAVLTLLRQF